MMKDKPEHVEFAIETLLPSEMARQAELIGERKAKFDLLSLLTLAVLGGAYIGLGSMFATTIATGAEGVIPFGLSRLLAGLTFSLGLVVVILGGAELFTGNTLMVMALAAGKIKPLEMAQAWCIVYLGNFIGAIGTALLVLLSGQYLIGNGTVAIVALKLAVDKSSIPFIQAIFLGILCNVLVCLAVWLSLGARTTSGKILVIIFPVSAFVAAGFEHSVANMYIIPLGILIRDWAPENLWHLIGENSESFRTLSWAGFLYSLIPVTIGNIIGGGGLVGVVYWFIYLRNKHE
jgi:formate transporter